MADILRTRVVGPVMLPDGSAAPNGAKLIFTLRSWDRQDGALIMQGPVPAVVIDGEIEVDLPRTSEGERGQLFQVSYTYFNGAQGQWLGTDLGVIALTGPGPVNLADLLAIPAPVPSVPDVLAQALAAAASAMAAAMAAEESIVPVLEDRLAAEAAAERAAEAAETAAVDAATAANALIAPAVAASTANATQTAADRVAAGQAVIEARAARDAATTAQFINRGWVATSAALTGISSPANNDRALTLNDYHVYGYNGTAWVDEGESILARKLDVIAFNAFIANYSADKLGFVKTLHGFNDNWLLSFVSENDGSLILGVDTAMTAHVGAAAIASKPYVDTADAVVTENLRTSRVALETAIDKRVTLALGGKLTPDYAMAFTTEKDGSVIAGFLENGRFVYDQRAVGVDAFACDNVGYMIDAEDGVMPLTTINPVVGIANINQSDLPVIDARIDGDSIRLIQRRRALWDTDHRNNDPAFLIIPDGTPLITRLPVRSAPFVNTGIQKVYAVVNYGQSFASFSNPKLTVTPVAAGRALMYSGSRFSPKLSTWGVSANVPDWAVGPNDYDKELLTIGNLLSNEGETPSPGMAAHLLRSTSSVPEDAAIFMLNLANGGMAHLNLAWATHRNLTNSDTSLASDIEEFSGYRFEQIIRGLKMLKHHCRLNKLDLEIRAITYMHGEADAGQGNGYLPFLEHLQGGFTDRVSYITGQTYEVPVICDQADFRKPEREGSVSWAQLQAGLNHPGKIICAGPHYWMPRLSSEGSTDGLHPTAIGRRWLGHHYGRAMNKLWENGGYLPLHMSAAVRSGAEITLTFAGNEGPLVFDTTNVAAIANMGITWIQTGGVTQTISTVEILDATHIKVTLSGDPGTPTSSKIRIASNVFQSDFVDGDPEAGQYGPILGPRANIRDSSTTLAHGTDPLYNWACNQEINV